MSETHLTAVRFDSFDLDPRILAGLADAGFTFCTPIQAEALPIALAGHDVAGQAQTGTGKTAAFLVAALQRLLHPPGGSPALGDDQPAHGRARPRVVILAPTRELAIQIYNDAVVLAAHTGFRLAVVFGGTGYQEQRDALAAGVDILIGTPGRLIDYYKQKVFDLTAVQVAVLDEADRMFDLGFIKDIRFVLRRMPPPEQRLGMLFSATLSYRVTELAYEHMNHPRMIEIAPEQVTAERVRQRCYLVGNDEKIPLLIGLLRALPDARAMVFVNTKRQGERVWGYLEGNGLPAAMLSGDVPQKKRLKLLGQFQAGELPIMVATDVAARGLHIPGVTHVINYDLPEDAEDYVHRIGRTARAGAAGDAISFACETYAFSLPEIEQFIGARIEVAPHDPALFVAVDPGSRVPAPRRPRDERHGKRGEREHGSRTGGDRHGRHGHERPHAHGDHKHGHGERKHAHEDHKHGHGGHRHAQANATAAAGEPDRPAAVALSADGPADAPAAPASAEPAKRRRRRSKGPRPEGATPAADAMTPVGEAAPPPAGAGSDGPPAADGAPHKRRRRRRKNAGADDTSAGPDLAAAPPPDARD